MAKVAEDLTLEVKAKLTVDRATAEACLKMVEVREDGELKLYYEAIGASKGRCRFGGG